MAEHRAQTSSPPGCPERRGRVPNVPVHGPPFQHSTPPNEPVSIRASQQGLPNRALRMRLALSAISIRSHIPRYPSMHSLGVQCISAAGDRTLHYRKIFDKPTTECRAAPGPRVQCVGCARVHRVVHTWRAPCTKCALRAIVHPWRLTSHHPMGSMRPMRGQWNNQSRNAQ